MRNLAGNAECDQFIIQELEAANIPVVQLENRAKLEVPYGVVGQLGQFEFVRNWYYYSVHGPMPISVARKLYADPIGRKDIRVAGYSGNIPPDRWACGLYFINDYHIDSQEGLNLFADTIRNPFPIDNSKPSLLQLIRNLEINDLGELGDYLTDLWKGGHKLIVPTYDDAEELIREGGEQAAVVIETFVSCNLKGTEILITAALRQQDNEKCAILAAQRARWVKFTDEALKLKAWFGFCDRINHWKEQNNTWAIAISLPSAPYLNINGLSLLDNEVINGDSRAAGWAALGIAEWYHALHRLDVKSYNACEYKSKLFIGLLARVTKELDLRKEDSDSIALLLEAIGAVTELADLEKAIPVIKRGFLEARTIEDAAAIGAAQRLTNRYGAKVIELLRHEFTSADPSEKNWHDFDRFVALFGAYQNHDKK